MPPSATLPAVTDRRRATYQDVLDAPPNMVAEVIDGQLVLMPRPAKPHALAASALGQELGPPFQRGKGGPGGWFVLDEPELHLGGDILVPESGRLAPRADAGLRGRRAVLHARSRLGVRGAVAPNGQDRSLRQASNLCARAGGSRVARRSAGPDARESCGGRGLAGCSSASGATRLACVLSPSTPSSSSSGHCGPARLDK